MPGNLRMSSPISLCALAATACLTILFLSHTTVALSDAGERAFGKKVIAEYELPPEQIAKFAAFEPSAPTPGESTLTSTLLAKTEDWTGPAFDGNTSGNPYTIVVTLSGSATTDGPSATLWNAGWAILS